MSHRSSVPAGAPAWTDLATSDVDASIAFYTRLFGWECTTPNPDLGGYANFLRDGEMVAGVMPGFGDPVDTWTVHFAVDDTEKSATLAAERGGTVFAPAMDVCGLLDLAVVGDPGGAALGLMTPKAHPGLLVTNEPGTPFWFELHTREYAAALAFYEQVLGWEVVREGDTDEFRYAQAFVGGQAVAGVMDAASFLPPGAAAEWAAYWQVEDADATVARAVELGGAVVSAPFDTPYGKLATLTDSTGAQFKLCRP